MIWMRIAEAPQQATGLLLLVCISVVSAYNQTTWKLGDYPNPMDTPEKCGASTVSYLCDPDGFLTEGKGK